MQRSQKTVSLIYLFCGFLTWMIARELVATIWVAAGIPMPIDWMISPPDIVAAGAGILTFVLLVRSTRVNEFTNEVITELSRVVWPARKETMMSTGVVSVLVAICALIFFLFDMLWGAVVRIFYG
ncbi:MAG TPA: preprotein translocase subunit SecE [bacterium]|nr:preprotein translocase subunit SecE [bacterium]